MAASSSGLYSDAGQRYQSGRMACKSPADCQAMECAVPVLVEVGISGLASVVAEVVKRPV